MSDLKTLTCKVDKGGCGLQFEVTDELLSEYKLFAENGIGSGCPNSACSRVVPPEDLLKIVITAEQRSGVKIQAASPSKQLAPGFPLHFPLVPSQRRKNGATPGTCFRSLAAEDLDRPPTPDEVRRVQRFFSRSLDDGTDCPCCTRHARRQHRPLGAGPARWLIELVYLSDQNQPIHTGEILKALKGHHISGSDATSVLPLYGLIEPAADPDGASNPPPPSSRANAKGRTSGFWRPTKLGRAFALDKVKVPERVVTCLGIPELFEGDPIGIRDALDKKFNYDEIRGRWRDDK